MKILRILFIKINNKMEFIMKSRIIFTNLFIMFFFISYNFNFLYSNNFNSELSYSVKNYFLNEVPSYIKGFEPDLGELGNFEGKKVRDALFTTTHNSIDLYQRSEGVSYILNDMKKNRNRVKGRFIETSFPHNSNLNAYSTHDLSLNKIINKIPNSTSLNLLENRALGNFVNLIGDEKCKGFSFSSPVDSVWVLYERTNGDLYLKKVATSYKIETSTCETSGGEPYSDYSISLNSKINGKCIRYFSSYWKLKEGYVRVFMKFINNDYSFSFSNVELKFDYNAMVYKFKITESKEGGKLDLIINKKTFNISNYIYSFNIEYILDLNADNYPDFLLGISDELLYEVYLILSQGSKSIEIYYDEFYNYLPCGE